MPKWLSEESADTLEEQREWRTSTRTGGTSTWNATSGRNTPCATSWDWRRQKLWNRMYAIQVCVYTFSSSQHQFFNHDAYTKVCKHDKDFIPDLLSTLSAVWKYRRNWLLRWQQPFQRIWEQRRELIERNGSFEYYHYLQWADTLKNILKDIFICTMKEQCSDKWKRTWRG